MNKRDQENLEFIKSLNTDELYEWIDTLSQDDINYALELIDNDIEQLREQLTELRLENLSHYSEAEAIWRNIAQ